MFNRHIQVKMVKNETKTPDVVVEKVTAFKFAQARQMIKDLTRTAAVGVVGYVVVDTFRQVVIAKATHPK